ncbi:MAG: GNAT family N-acetyltransferase [Actinobacteria bacterium]|nr:GNAT family N-acetyltransferase [Actinomycetota bacterium]MBU1494738.1 GNAT family N-acetyltransferase [Actinomycetota bacterium]MBU1865477.1 GNAT family N-acetyltransferase [Actinomycetota bacterium]
MEFSIRDATRADEPFLIEMLYQALFVPPGEPPLPPEIVDRPDLARYARGFGHQKGDQGWIAESPAAGLLGAAWVRQLPAEDPGYGFVDADTPELSIAVVPDRRSRGLGTALLGRLLGAVPRCSLSVDDRNAALRLYERCGFEVVSTDGHSLKMLRPSC